MTECQVICRDCKGIKRWNWLCETCAEECLDNHRRQTGHRDLELRVTQPITMGQLIERINTRREFGPPKRRTQ